jgi:hypothetical protein
MAGSVRRADMTRSGLDGFGRTLNPEDEVVVEATGNAMAVVRVLRPHVARVIVANPLQVKAIAHAQVKTDKIDAGVLASLRAAGFLPCRHIWCRRVRMLTYLAGWAGPGSGSRRCRMTSGQPSRGICTSSTAWARIWMRSIGILLRPR